MSVEGLKRLQVWVRAKDYALEIYKQVLPLLPFDEKWNLDQQLRRSSLSISANIAEGHGRKATGAYLNHISIALGSVMELETQLQIALRLNFIDESTCTLLLSQSNEIGRMLGGLRKSISNQSE